MINRYIPVEWAHTTNIYEVNIRQYTAEGTFRAFTHHLKRLKDMGVKTLWFMPVTPISKKNMKGEMGSYYACSDYISVNPEFGTLQDFKHLVRQAHDMGFNIIIDWVANHTGWDHTWTQTNPEFYKIDEATNDFKMASGMEDIIELDFKNPALRRAMIEAMQFWVKECDIDGFRCDLAFWVELDFWKEARPLLDKIKPLFWLGEFDELERPEYGETFDASYSWTWMHKTEDFYKKNEPLDGLILLLKKYDDLGDSTMRTWFTSNHDENTWNGTEYEKYGEMAKALAVFSATWNGIPLVYSGQELPNLKRLEFFKKDTINWSHDISLHEFYKKILDLHTEHPALRSGDPSAKTFILQTSASKNVFAFLRKNGTDEILVILNLSAENQFSFEITDQKLSGVFSNIFTGNKTDFNNDRSIILDAWEYLLYKK
jgi:glycosidase